MIQARGDNGSTRAETTDMDRSNPAGKTECKHKIVGAALKLNATFIKCTRGVTGEENRAHEAMTCL